MVFFGVNFCSLLKGKIIRNLLASLNLLDIFGGNAVLKISIDQTPSKAEVLMRTKIKIKTKQNRKMPMENAHFN